MGSTSLSSAGPGATSVGQIGLDLVVNKKQFTRQMNGIEDTARETGKKLESSINQPLSRTTDLLKKVGSAFAAAFAVKKIVDFGKECLDLGSDLQEVQNVVNVTFPQMTAQVDQFAKSAAQSFGLSETMAKRYTGTFGAMAKAFGFSEKSAYDMATTLTGLAGDVASFYNISQDEAYTKLKSVFTGETESLKDLGVVMTQAALDQYALANGFGKTTEAMSEAEKVALRYSFVQQQLSAASGDFVRTSGSWANQVRILKLQFDSLKATIGQGLINLFTPVIKVINTLLGKLTTLANAFKSFTELITGNKSNSGASNLIDTASGLSDAAGAAQNLEDRTEDVGNAASQAAKKMKALMGFDTIQKLSDLSSSDGASSGGSTASPGGGTIAGSIVDFGSLAQGETVVDKLDDKLTALFKNIKKYAQPSIDALKRLWNEGLKELGKFSGKALTDFYESFLKPLSKWVLGKGFPSLVDAVNKFLQKIDWDKLNRALKRFWEALEPFAEAVGEGLIRFISDLLSFGADVLNVVLPGIFNGLATILESIDKEDAENIGYVLGMIITAATAKKIGKAISNLLDLKSALFGFGNSLKGWKVSLPNGTVPKRGGLFSGLKIGLASWFGADILADTLAEAITGKEFNSATTVIKDTVSGFLGEGFEGGIKNFVNGAGGNIATSVQWMMEKIFGKDSEAAKTARRWAESSNFWEEFAKPWLSKLPETIKEIGSNGIFGKTIVPLFEGIGNAIEENKDGNLFTTYIWPGLSKLGGNLISGIKEGFTGQFSQMGDAVKGFFNNFSNWFSNGGKMTEKEARSMYGIIGDVIIGKWKDTFENSTSIWDAAKTAIIGKWTEIKNAAPGTFEGIKNTIGNVWNNVSGTTSNIWETIKNSLSSGWQGIKSNASSIFSGIKTNISGIWTSISSNTSSVWGSISSGVQRVWNSLKSSASNIFNSIKSVVSNVWNGIRNITSNIWNGIVGTIKGAVNGIIGGINGMIRGIVSGINSVISALNRFNVKIPDWVPLFGGKTFGFNLRKISAPQIPYLAEGGFVKPNTPQLAMIGDNRHQGEIVAPEDKLQEMALEAVKAASGNGITREDLERIINNAVLRIVSALASLGFYVDGEQMAKAVQMSAQSLDERFNAVEVR